MDMGWQVVMRHQRGAVSWGRASQSSLFCRTCCYVLSTILTTCLVFCSLLGPVEDFLLKKAEAEPEDFNKLYVVAASFEDVDNHTIVRGLFNNQAYHSPALALTLLDNYLFKLLSGARASITVSNHPQPQTAVEFSENILYQYV